MLLVRASRDRGVVGARFIPLRLTNGFPRPLTTLERDSALRAYADRLAPAGLALTRDGEVVRRRSSPR